MPLAYGYSIKKFIYFSIIWRWTVLCKKQDGGWIKICEIFSGTSLKEDLSIDTTFDPCYFCETVPLTVKNCINYCIYATCMAKWKLWTSKICWGRKLQQVLMKRSVRHLWKNIHLQFMQFSLDGTYVYV